MDLSPPRRPDREGTHDGLAYTLWLPDEDPVARGAPAPGGWPGIVVLHGAGSCKENHADFARLCAASGWAALAFDQRGHGDSEGEMGPAAIGDAAAMARLLGRCDGVDPTRVAVRGSSMGGFVAIIAAAEDPVIAGVIAICAAEGRELARGLRRGKFTMRIGDPVATELWLMQCDLGAAAAQLAGRPLLLMHAEGDEQVDHRHSEALYERAGEPRRLLLVPGGDHRSLQHDAELSSTALRWLGERL